MTLKLSEVSDRPKLKAIRAPVPTSPEEGDDDITSPGPLSAEEMESAYDNLELKKRHFQVKHQGDSWADAIIDTEVEDTELQDADLPNDTDLTWRCRDIDNEGNVSDWSEEINFSVVATEVLPPELISPSDGETKISITSDQTLEAGDFEINDGEDTFDKAEWRVLEPNTNNEIWSTETSEREATIPENTLEAETSYQWQARYKGVEWGWSNWSDRYSFTTGEATVTQPEAVSPSDGDTDIDHDSNLTLEASEFDVIGDTDTWIGVEWELYEGSDVDTDNDSPVWVDSMDSATVSTETTVDADELSASTDYHWRVRYEGDRWGWSIWSDLASFTTKDPYIARPENDHPSDGSVGVSSDEYLTLAATDMEVVGGSDEIDTAEWELYIEGESSPTSTYTSTSNSVSVPPEDLSADTNYEWRMRYIGEEWGESEWSNKTAFTTTEARVEQPTNESPSDGETDIDPESNLTLEASDFNVVDGDDSFEEAEWEVYTGSDPDPDNDDPHWTHSNVSTDTTISSSDLDVATTYHWRVRYKGEDWGWSRWSDLTSFETITPEVAQPENLSPEDEATDISNEDLTLEASDFEVNDGDDNFKEAHWELYKEGESTPVWTTTTTS